MAVGAFFWGYVGDHFGRRLSFSLTVWLTFIGGVLSAFSVNYLMLLLLRFTAAFGIGGMLPVDYTVFLEFLPSEDRGSHIVMVDAIGVVPALTLSAVIAWYYSETDEVEWRKVLFISSIPVGIMAVLRRHVPESPRYYLAAGETEEAQRVVQSVADKNNVELPENWELLPYQNTQQFRGDYTVLPTQQELTQLNGTNATQQISSDTKRSEVQITSPENVSNAEQKTGIPSSNGNENEQLVTHAGNGHSFSELLQSHLRPTTWRLWLLYFLLQFSSAGMVFALPKLFFEIFAGKSERDIALYLLIGVVGLIPGLAIAYVAVEKSRTKTLAAFLVSAGVSVLCLGGAFLVLKSQMWALIFSILLRGAMEGCFAVLNTAAVESYPTLLRASGLGTAQIFDHIAGSISPVIFSVLNGHVATQRFAFMLYAAAYILAAIPALTLTDYAGAAISDSY